MALARVLNQKCWPKPCCLPEKRWVSLPLHPPGPSLHLCIFPTTQKQCSQSSEEPGTCRGCWRAQTGHLIGRVSGLEGVWIYVRGLRVCVRMHACKCMCMHMHACECVCACACAWACECVCVHVCASVHLHILTNVLGDWNPARSA